MALTVGDLVAYLKVDDSDFSSKIGGAEGKFGGFAASAIKYGAAIGTAVAAAGVALYKVGSTFDDVSDTIRVGTGATGEALEGLNQSAKNIGHDVPANFADIGTAVADLNTRLGLTGAPLEDMATQFLNLSRITGTDLKTNIAGLTRMFGDWSIETAKQPAALDAIYRASQATGVGIDSLSASATQFGGPMRQLGFSFEETLAMLGNFEKQGVNTNLVMGSMRIALGKMARAGEDPASTFRRVTEEIKNAGSAGEANAMALELFGAKAGPDMAAAIREGRFELGGLVDQIANGSDTINTAAADTADFAESWQVFKNRALLAIEPIATRVFNAIGKGMEWFLAVGVPAISTFAATVRDQLVPPLTNVAQTVIPALISAFQAVASAVASTVGFFREHETAAKALGIAVGVVAAMVAAAWVAQAAVATANAARTVIAWFATATASTTSATIQSRSTAQIVVGWLAASAAAIANGARIAVVWTAQIVASAVAGAASFMAQVARVVAGWVLMGVQSMIQAARMAAAWLIAMGPIGWVIAAVIALVALIIANWDTIVAWTKVAWDAVVGAVSAAWEWIKGVVSAGFDFLVMLFMNFTGVGLMIQHWDTIKNATQAAWDWIKSAVSAAIDFLVMLFLNFTGVGLIIQHWETIKNATSAAWNAITGAISAAWGAITGIISGAVAAVRNAVSGAWNAVQGATSSAWNAITGAVSNAWNAITGAVSNGVNGVLNYVRALPGQIVSALGNLGSLLSSAGRAVIDGFINGIKSAFNRVKDTLSSLTSLLPDWKGPAQRDATILKDAGRLVMGGFEDGLVSKFGAVRSTLQSLTSDLAATGTASIGLRGPSTVGAEIGAGAGSNVYNINLNMHGVDFNKAQDRRRIVAEVRSGLIALEREGA